MVVGLLGTVGCAPAVTGDDGAHGGSETTGGSSTTDPTTDPTPVTTSSSTTSDDAFPTTDGSESGTADEGPDETGDFPGGFYAGPPPDGGNDDFGCDLFEQDCPEGEKCMPWANDGGPVWNATRCSPVLDDPAGIGEPCLVEGSFVSGLDDCGLQSMCFGVDPDTNIGQCVPLCTGDWSEPLCDPGQVCTPVGDLPIPLCAESCNPLAFDCTDGNLCTPAGDTFGCLPPSSSAGQGDPCEVVTACDPGHACIDDSLLPECEGSSCCSSLCDLSAPTCPDGLTCVEWYRDGEAPEGFEDLGACIVP